MTTENKTTAERLVASWDSTRHDLELFADVGFQDFGELDERDVDPDVWQEYMGLGDFSEYGLCFDWVKPCTFNDQPAGYYRFQFSWGGPSTELRFLGSGAIEYWFLDWGRGEKVRVECEPCIRELARYFQEVGLMENFAGVVDYWAKS